ncbi:ModD protein [Photobacterium chitinilyticum]|uniref:Putative pyrophosphorylase ModD n=1 Tax=Photobacterium chitinilyticum TaxID=2485123 RepID=A0A3S3UPV0_9GAMM|nr:ModD protein [Photobacterium chitinilyticum]RWX57448.1 ModD protein [Photobacterium chitinilyticum]
MLYFSDYELDTFLLEDAYRGDLTTRSLGIGQHKGKMVFKRKQAGRVAGVEVAHALLTKLGLQPVIHIADGVDVDAGTVLLEVEGKAEQLHTGWKAAQVVLEWCCGVAQYTADMVAQVQLANPNGVVACTRKSIPGTRKLATAAVLAGGGHIHRAGLSETLLVFTNHRRLCQEPENWQQHVVRLRQQAPENKITVEADTLDQVAELVKAAPDIIQLDKFSVAEVLQSQQLLAKSGQQTMLSVAGGINRNNAAEYARTGVTLFITSAPYYAAPEDIKVIITPI